MIRPALALFTLSLLFLAPGKGFAQEKEWRENRKKALATVAKGRYKEALPYFEKAYSAAHKLGATDPRLGQSVYEFGDYQRVMRSEKAIPLLERAKYLWTGALKPGDPRFAHIHQSVGLVHWQNAQYSAAEKSLRLARDIFGKVDKSSVEYGQNCHYLARVFHANGDLLKAERFHRRGLAVLEKTSKAHWSLRLFIDFLRRVGKFKLGEELLAKSKAWSQDSKRSKAVSNHFLTLGRFRLSQRRWSEVSVEAGLKAVKRDYGAAHPYYAEALLIGAWQNYHKAQDERVKSLAAAASKVLAASYGDKCTKLAEAELLLGLAGSQRSDWAKASVHLKTALRLLKNEEGLREKELGQRCLMAFGELSSRQGRFREARDFYNRAAAYGKKIYRAKNHYMVARVALRRADLALTLGRVRESLEQCKAAETILVDHFGDKYQEGDVVSFLRLQARFLKREKGLKEGEAKDLYERVKERYGEGHPFEDEARALLARVYLYKKSYSKAETLIRALLKRRKASWGVSHWRTAECQLLLGRFQQRKKEDSKAYFYYLGALKVYVKTFDSGHPHLIEAYTWLGEVSMDQKKFDKAVKVFQRALKTGEKTLGKDSRFFLPILDGLYKALRKVGKRSEAKSIKERAAKLRERVALEDDA